MTDRTEQRPPAPTFAQIQAKAAEVFGSHDAAERWFSQPVMGLDRQIPLELLQTPAGTDLVCNFLTRLEFGVYT